MRLSSRSRSPTAPCSPTWAWARCSRYVEAGPAMLDSINVGVTGLLGYQQALRVIANNTANLNTPGYKSSTLGFADLFYADTPASGGNTLQLGQGLDTTGTHLNFTQGEMRQTG